MPLGTKFTEFPSSKKKENSYFKLLDQLKSLQKELAEYRKVADECKAEVLRVKTHPATKATELYRESILLLNECFNPVANDDDNTNNTSSSIDIEVVASDLVDKFKEIAKNAQVGADDLRRTLGNSYVGLAKVGSLKHAWTLAIRNGERALIVWRDIEDKDEEFEMLQLLSGIYVHAYVDNGNMKLLDRSLDKLKFCVSAAKFGKQEWQDMLPEFEKMSDNVNEVKANGKTVTYNKRSKGNFHDLLFELVM